MTNPGNSNPGHSSPACSVKREAEPSDPARKRLRYLMDDGPTIGGKAVSVRVGAVWGSELFIVHEELVRANSAFFNAVFSKDLKELKERTVELPEISPDHFKVYLKWLYTGRLFIQKDGDDREGNSVEWSRWQECYAMGDFLQDPDFKDAAIDAAIEKMAERNRGYANLAETIYKHSVATCPARKLAVDTTLTKSSMASIEKHRQNLKPVEFIGDLMIAFAKECKKMNDLVQDPFTLKDTCVYHEHSLIGKACYKTKRGYLF